MKCNSVLRACVSVVYKCASASRVAKTRETMNIWQTVLTRDNPNAKVVPPTMAKNPPKTL